MTEAKYSVFVDGNEVNNYYLTRKQAENLRDDYLEDDYDCVEIVDMTEEMIKLQIFEKND